MTTINKIQLYRHNEGWYFDDINMGVKQEPLVFGFPAIIDKIISDPKTSIINLLFSNEEIPNYNTILVKVDPEGLKIGAYYVCEKTNFVAWLPQSFNYYLPEFPDELYIKVEKIFREDEVTIEITRNLKEDLEKIQKPQTPLIREEKVIAEFFDTEEQKPIIE